MQFSFSGLKKTTMQKIHTISTPPVMNTSNTSTTSDLIASVVAGHKINNKTNSSNKKISSSVGVSNNNNNNEPTTNINENGNALKIAKPIPAKPNGKNGNFKHIKKMNFKDRIFSSS